MSKGSGVSRGDRRRNARLAELRLLVSRENAIAGIDLAEDNQALVVTDHDSKVLARRSPRCKAWQLGEVLDWAVGKAKARGFESVTVACEPTGSRWMHVQQACAERGLNFVCVQTLVTHNAREAEDYTRDKSDQKDAVLIARLAAELRRTSPACISGNMARTRPHSSEAFPAPVAPAISRCVRCNHNPGTRRVKAPGRSPHPAGAEGAGI